MFSRTSNSGYALLIDIGSGSVGLSIVSSTDTVGEIWSHREHCPLKTTESVNESSKAVVTTAMNAMMLFESEGRAALHEHSKAAKINTIQATVSAPWSYTVARTIKFEKDDPFVITEDLLTQLAASAEKQAMEEFEAEHSLVTLGIKETSHTILDVHANGYRVATPNKQQATQLAVTHVSTLIRNEIVDTLQEMKEKLLPDSELHVTSYMLANYYVTDALQPMGVDFCLVDITNEATELGIVRHNALQYSTHSAFGRSSIAREVSKATKTPLHDAFSSLRTLHKQDDLHKDISTTLDSYQDKIAELFKETGDRLTIPKHIYLQADAGLGEFFAPLIENAGKEASKGNVLVTVTSPGLLYTDKTDNKFQDIALVIAMRFFHTTSDRAFFEYL